jgi:hypothetical protein
MWAVDAGFSNITGTQYCCVRTVDNCSQDRHPQGPRLRPPRCGNQKPEARGAPASRARSALPRGFAPGHSPTPPSWLPLGVNPRDNFSVKRVRGTASVMTVRPDGSIQWRNKEGKYHREDGPAREWPVQSAKAWYGGTSVLGAGTGAEPSVWFWLLMICSLLRWAMTAKHTADLAEPQFFFEAFGAALLDGCVFAIPYLALEPYVRRRWPQSFISWSRTIAARWWDPLVGSQVLAGIALGIGLKIVETVGILQAPRLCLTARRAFDRP